MNKNIVLVFLMIVLSFLTTACGTNKEGDKTFFKKEIFSFDFNKDARFVIYDKDYKYGYIDKTGNVVIKPQFEYAEDFVDGVALVRNGAQDNYYEGLIDTQGNFILKMEYQSIHEFSEDLAAVVSEGKAGYVNKKGQFVIWPKYDLAGSFHNGLAKVQDGAKGGYINKKGEYVIYPKYDYYDMGDFKNNKALVRIGDKYVLINKKGEIVQNINAKYAYELNNDFYVIKDDKYKEGLMDTNGKVVIAPKYDSLYSDGEEDKYFVYRIGHNIGVMDRNLKEIIPAKYENEPVFSKNSIVFIDYTNNQSYIHDDKGALISKVNYILEEGCSKTLCLAADKNSKFGFIDKKGNVVLPFVYSYAANFENGLAQANETKGNKLIMGYIDPSGKFVYKNEEEIEPLETDEPEPVQQTSKPVQQTSKPAQKTTYTNSSSNNYYNSYNYSYNSKSQDIQDAESAILN